MRLIEQYLLNRRPQGASMERFAEALLPSGLSVAVGSSTVRVMFHMSASEESDRQADAAELESVSH